VYFDAWRNARAVESWKRGSEQAFEDVTSSGYYRDYDRLPNNHSYRLGYSTSQDRLEQMVEDAIEQRYDSEY